MDDLEGLDTLTIGFAIYHLREPDSAPKPLDTEFMRYNRSCARSKVFVNLREVSNKMRMRLKKCIIHRY